MLPSIIFITITTVSIMLHSSTIHTVSLQVHMLAASFNTHTTVFSGSRCNQALNEESINVAG